jgi:hypothetical protein
MNSKQKKTFELIFKDPMPPDIAWPDIESLLVALGAEISEGAGSRLRVNYDGIQGLFGNR